MDKSKKNTCKKTLVRNTLRKIPQTKLVIDIEPEKPSKSNEEKENVGKTDSNENFENPDLYSTLKLVKEIDKIEKTKPNKVNSVPQLALDEKITRLVNFPTDKPIYKNLIPLKRSVQSQPFLAVRNPLPPKDQEPILTDYVRVYEGKEYVHETSYPHELPRNQYKTIDNLKLYKILQMNSLN